MEPMSKEMFQYYGLGMEVSRLNQQPVVTSLHKSKISVSANQTLSVALSQKASTA